MILIEDGDANVSPFPTPEGLLAETERLTQDRLDLQRQAEKDHSTLSQRLRTLEREMEEQETKAQEELLHNKNHIEDLSQQVQALEKQLKHNRQFIEVTGEISLS